MFKTEQENFWAGDFGNEYIKRNKENSIILSDLVLFTDIIKNTRDVSSIIEFGSNIGLNLMALKVLKPDAEISAIEINKNAIEILKNNIENIQVYNQSILEYQPDKKRDFVLIKGVLIHINPEELKNVYQKLYETSKRYICICEYYNPTPVSIDYRGHKDKLFKRDFAGEFMDAYPDVELVDYGFKYHRDNNFKMDDVTWFLMKKKNY